MAHFPLIHPLPSLSEEVLPHAQEEDLALQQELILLVLTAFQKRKKAFEGMTEEDKKKQKSAKKDAGKAKDKEVLFHPLPSPKSETRNLSP